MMYDWDEYDEIDLFSFDFPRRRPRKERKDPNECQVSNCRETKERYNDYCTNHDWECSADNCKNRLHYQLFGIYCSEHKYSCQTERCKQRVDSSYKYCSEHERKYFCRECVVRVPTGESYCSQHKNWKYCPTRNKVCRINEKMTFIKDWSINGSSIFPRYDEEENCQRKAFNGQKYCSKHQNECLEYSCQRRLDKSNKYCYEHAPACPTICQSGSVCISKVTTGDTYCSSHSKICLACSYRVSADRDYCWDHERVCSDCSARTAYNKYVCWGCENKNQEQNRLKSLVKQRTSLSNPQEVVRFETWWSNNLAIVINGNYSYTVWLLVYEPAIKSRSEILQKFEINQDYDKSSLASAKNKALRVRNELDGENPILAIIGSYGTVSPSTLLSKPYVLEREIPHKTEIEEYGVQCRCYPDCPCYHCTCNDYWTKINCIYPSNPDEHLKPLDIVKVKNKKGTTYFHFAIYLGRGKISHITSDNRGVKIESWSDFLDGAVGELVRYHPIIPFKKWDDALRQIVKAALSNYKRGQYNLCNDNCEHYAWEQIIGIDYSGQAIERPQGASFVDWWKGRGNYSVKYWTSVNLQSMIRKSSQKFDNLKSSDDYQVRNEIKKIKGSESEWQSRIEVPYKSECRVM